jgi:Uma2 family endonuclease
VDGTLVEKPMGYYESILALSLSYFIHRYLDQQPIGVVSGPDGPMKIVPPRVRMPDLALVRWERLPGRRLPRGGQIPVVAPDLAVEVLSATNTEEEMQQKLQEYFAGGVRLAWYIDPEARSARMFTSPDRHTVLDEQGVLDGADVLPGFQLRLGDLFDRAEKGAGELG